MRGRCCCIELLLLLCGMGGGGGKCCDSRPPAPPERPIPPFLPLFAGPNDSPYTLCDELYPPPPMLPPPNSLCALPMYMERGAPGSMSGPAGFQFCIIMLDRIELMPLIPPATLPPEPNAEVFELRSHSSAAAAMACWAAAIWYACFAYIMACWWAAYMAGSEGTGIMNC